MRLIGLTGGIGSGKSAVADAFRALGVEVVDADQVAHELSARGHEGYQAIVDAFGESVLDPAGTLDRDRLRALVFADPRSRARLESVLHPLIAARIATTVARWRGPYGIVVAPLLLERGNLMRDVSRVLVVDCPEDLQVHRTMQRSGLSESEARAIMDTQLSRAARLARADDVLDNSGPLGAIAGKVAALDVAYRAMAAQHA
ncbi:MAG: dephospho-CoA kinase [Casimicrobiaceae bacterium]